MRSQISQRGYSLYELLLTTLMVGTVIVLGVPSFNGMLADSRLRTDVDAFFHAVHLARKESVVRRRAVSLCPSTDGQMCLPEANWSAGWIMFVNLDRDSPATADPGEPLLWWHRGHRQNRVLGNRKSFTFRSTELRATNGTLIFCDTARRARPRALVVSYTGRPRVTGEDRHGKAYDCRE